MKIAERQIYLQRLISKMNNGMIKIITGVRRSGKSFLLFNLFYKYLLKQGIKKQNIITLAMDDAENSEFLNPEKLASFLQNRTNDEAEPYFILLDEVQLLITREELKNKDSFVKLYGILNGLLRKNNVDVYVTGSNSKFLSNDEEKVRYLTRLNREIYLKDISERYSISNSSGMEELQKVISSSIGSLINPQKIANTFITGGQKGISAPTIKDYLQYLQEAFLIQKAERYDVKGRKYITTPVKYYYADTGLRNAILGFRQFEETHLMENVIYNELIFRGFSVDVGVVEINCKENKSNVRKQLEVDFVANLGNRRYYIQSAFAIPDLEKMQQEQSSLLHVPDSFKKIIVVGTQSPIWRNEQGITIMSIYDFLVNENSLDV